MFENSYVGFSIYFCRLDVLLQHLHLPTPEAALESLFASIPSVLTKLSDAWYDIRILCVCILTKLSDAWYDIRMLCVCILTKLSDAWYDIRILCVCLRIIIFLV